MRQYVIYGLLPALTFIFSLGLIFGLSASAQEDVVVEATAYLETTGPIAWSTLALTAAGQEPDLEHLKDTEGEQAINYPAPILALTAANKDPRTYPDSDLVQELLTYHREGQIGDPSLLNDNIFAILALVAADEGDHPAVADARSFLLDKQLTDGSWGMAVESNGDTNTTAVAVMALIATGSAEEDPAVTEALDYLQQAQNEDGGFPYISGGLSDASSSAWVLSMINVLDTESLEDWTLSGRSPRDHLLSLQSDEGYFRHQPESRENAFTPIETSYAVIALSGYGYPVETGASNETDSVPTVRFRILGQENEICRGTVVAETPLMVIEKAADQCDYNYQIEQTDFGPYLTSLDGLSATGQTGWLYTVNWQSMDQITVGAADWELEEHDYVLWLFDDWQQADQRIMEQKGSQAEVPLRVELAEEEEEKTPEISFQITAPDGSDPEFIFQAVERGQLLKETVVLHNQGTVALATAGSVSGHLLFRDYLNIAGHYWRQYGDTLEAGQSVETELSLTVPTGPELAGPMEGTLVFWATAK